MINRLMKHKRGIALGLALLMGGGAVGPTIFKTLVYAIEGDGKVTGTENKYWNKEGRPYPLDYYGKVNRKYFGKLELNGKATICLDSVKKLNRGKSGTIAEYSFDGNPTFATGISREGAEMLSYAMIMGGGGNGREITDDSYYILCQCLCWAIEYYGGNMTWENLDEWKVKTLDIVNYLDPAYQEGVKKAIERYCEESTRMLRPEAVASFMSKYPSEAPVLDLKYDEDTGIYSNDFELIDFADASAVGYDQVWMQYFLDYDAAVAKLEAEGKIDKGTLKMEHKVDGTKNWVHVEYTGDIETLKSCGPIPLHLKKGTDGYINTVSPTALDIWDPQRTDVQHMFMGVDYDSWTVYMNFGGNPPKTPSTSTGEGSYTVTVNTHKHEETFVSNYNIDLYKYDYETGQPLENSIFELYERFDDKDEVNLERDGAVELYKGGDDTCRQIQS